MHTSFKCNSTSSLAIDNMQGYVYNVYYIDIFPDDDS